MKLIEKDKARLLTRRALIISVLQALGLVTLAGRLGYLQVVERSRYASMAEDNRYNFRLIAPPRGQIVDRYERELAVNLQSFSLRFYPDQYQTNRAALNALREAANLLELSDSERQRLEKEFRRGGRAIPLIIHSFLNFEEMAVKINKAYNINAVQEREVLIRHYPLVEKSCHICGYLGFPTEDAADDNPILSQPEMRVGVQGLEKIYDEALIGEAGAEQVEVNSLGVILGSQIDHPPQSGARLRLTIDNDLQILAYDLLKDKLAATAIVMDVRDGGILSLVSVPGFDPNQFLNGIPQKVWNKLANDPLGPLNNKAVSGTYAPGSTFKLVTLLAALEAGITPQRQFFCNGFIDLGSHRFHCWKEHGHGTLDAIGAIRESCDVWFYEVSQLLSIDQIAATARKLGLGSPTKIDLNAEKSGLIPDRAWKKQRFKQPWYGGENLVNAIGQGYVQTTPLQLVRMCALIANGGKMVTPHLRKISRDESDIPFTEALDQNRDQALAPSTLDGVKEEHLALLRQAMIEVVAAPKGTARSHLLKAGKPLIGGKTGTSQVRRITMEDREEGDYKNEDIDWKLRDHALFIGFAPAENPRYAAVAVIEHGGSGSGVASPIVGELLWKALELDDA